MKTSKKEKVPEGYFDADEFFSHYIVHSKDDDERNERSQSYDRQQAFNRQTSIIKELKLHGVY